ncbi:MAG: DUF2284 domain-containing protein [Nitrospiraceae bacterium]|nr:DUF2284 domain-containing protein [Nitrospiraceae bacterium]
MTPGLSGKPGAGRERPGFQAIEDLATAYWLSECLFAAVEMGIFGLIESAPGGKSEAELSAALGAGEDELGRLLRCLCSLGLVFERPERRGFYFNSAAASRYLVPGKKDYQGDIVLWRRELRPRWTGLKKRILGNNVPGEGLKGAGRPTGEIGQKQGIDYGRITRYIRAMDSVARMKAEEIMDVLGPFPPEGEVLDAGAGSGAISAALLDRAPGLRATLMDIRQVIDLTSRMMKRRGFTNGEGGRITLCPANLLDPWPFEAGRFRLVILSNIIHVYSGAELPHILENAAGCLAGDGLMLIHDFFPEHDPVKASLFDLNMLVNTYNGRVFHMDEVRDSLLRMGLSSTGLMPLPSDTALLAASRDPSAFSGLRPDPVARLSAKVRGLGFIRVFPIRPEDVDIPGWTSLRCRYGCENFGRPFCPPDAPRCEEISEETRALIRGCSKALLLEGEPPSRDFQVKVLKAEKEAFVSGFYKAFSYWAGPCAICPSCAKDVCKNPRDRRPSMEGAGIDVFETARRAGLDLKTLSGRDEFVRYFALLLLE